MSFREPDSRGPYRNTALITAVVTTGTDLNQGEVAITVPTPWRINRRDPECWLGRARIRGEHHHSVCVTTGGAIEVVKRISPQSEAPAEPGPGAANWRPNGGARRRREYDRRVPDSRVADTDREKGSPAQKGFKAG